MLLQPVIHYSSHLLVPLLIAWIGFRKDWKKVYLILLATMLVDLDHLLANPIFQADRCSIGFHPLHTGWAVLVYIGMLFFRRPWNVIGIGLLWHMATDLGDCLMTHHHCPTCLEGQAVYPLIEVLGSYF